MGVVESAFKTLHHLELESGCPCVLMEDQSRVVILKSVHDQINGAGEECDCRIELRRRIPRDVNASSLDRIILYVTSDPKRVFPALVFQVDG